jgi:hypothetical protein
MNQVGVTNDTYVFSAIDAATYQSRLYTIANGAAPVLVDDTGGNPLTVANGNAYYNATAGLKRVAIPSGPPTVLTTSSMPFVSAIAVSGSDVFYATETCVFKLK